MYALTINETDLKWLQKALSKKDPRPFSSNILVKAGFAYATSGNVAHRLKVHNFMDGIYSYNGIKIEDDSVTHPLQNNDIFLGFENNVELSVNFKNLAILKISSTTIGVGRAKSVEVQTHSTTIGVSKKYFDSAVGRAKSVEVQIHNYCDRILIKYDNRQAIIMCLRIA